MLDDFKEYGVRSGGFTSAELETTRRSVEGLGSKITNKIHSISNYREDIGRLAHFMGAMEEEIGSRIAKGISHERAYAQGLRASITRVNKYKFDYNALTVFEQKYARRGIPFYTYMRKAAPLIVEAMWRSPRTINVINRFQDANKSKDPLTPSFFSGDQGFSQLIGGKNPWGITNDFTPQNTLQDTVDPSRWLSKLHPLVGLVSEAKTKKDPFTGAPVNSAQDAVFNLWRGTNTIRKITATTTGSKKATPWQEIALNFAGIPIKQITNQRKLQEANSVIKNISTELKSRSQPGSALEKAGYRVYFSGDKKGTSLSYKIATKKDANGRSRVIGQYSTWAELDTALKQLEQGQG